LLLRIERLKISKIKLLIEKLTVGKVRLAPLPRMTLTASGGKPAFLTCKFM